MRRVLQGSCRIRHRQILARSVADQSRFPVVVAGNEWAVVCDGIANERRQRTGERASAHEQAASLDGAPDAVGLAAGDEGVNGPLYGGLHLLPAVCRPHGVDVRLGVGVRRH